MRTAAPAAAVLLALLAACGEGPLDPGRFTLRGEWSGRSFPYEMALELRQDRQNRVSGTGELRGLREVLVVDTVSLEPLEVDTVSVDTVRTGAVEFRVRGEWEFPSFTLVLHREGFADATYAAAFAGTGADTRPDILEGRLEGPGFGAIPLTLVRR
jgi:hypothetical protein